MDNHLLQKAKKIKLIITDIDGVWTNSQMYYSEQGLFMKSFSTYDGMAAHLLHKYNFYLAMITSEYEHLDILYKRVQKLNIQEVYTNEHKKIDRVKYLLKKYDLLPENFAYIGDDLNDLDSLSYAGLSAVPNGAPILKHYNPDYITIKKGGHGAFRDLVDLILQAHNITPVY
tara:strand:- start:53751 stop:54266 length:516 start_codon:yes stop_codon:yes gene_type:complete